MSEVGLHSRLSISAQRFPDRLAVSDSTREETITYRELDELSDRVRDRLRYLGVKRGDRVGIYLRKSIGSVASIFGVLKAGAGYVPVDPTAPVERNAFVFANCDVAALVVEHELAEPLAAELASSRAESAAGTCPPMLILSAATAWHLRDALDRADAESAADVTESSASEPDDLAYILYTSGSTGKPKGVTLSHQNGASFIDWCSDIFEPTEHDRFSSHAPFHFDLSILDLYLPISHGASIHLIGEELGKNPVGMVELMLAAELTVWYSTPSVLRLLLDHGRLAEHEMVSLRHLFFAGEVFPVKHLRRLKQSIPNPRYFNLYGPTETNVCTYYEIPAVVPEERTQPYPIGGVCGHLKALVVDERERPVAVGEEGELLISGPSVMRGYWALPERTEAAYGTDTAAGWYRTGDLVVEGEDGVFAFVGRRDRMVKRRGYRIELGEIEAALYRHTDVSEAAALALSDQDGVTIKAFYSSRDGNPISMIELKRFCTQHLPIYMVPDRFEHLDSLPKTSTDKIDYQRLGTPIPATEAPATAARESLNTCSLI